MSRVAIEGNPSGTGTLTLSAPNTNTDRTLTLPDNTGTIITTASTFAGTGPAFSAYQSTKQTSITTNTWTKVVFQTEEFDTNNNFDNATNYSFTPTVAGYYQIGGGVAVATTGCSIALSIYKNGSSFKNIVNSNSNLFGAWGTALIYFNGTTDYVELYCFLGVGQQVDNAAANTYFQGSMVRSV